MTFLLNDPFSIDLIDETMLNDPKIIEICKQILISNGIHYKTTKKIKWYLSKEFYFLDMLPKKMVTCEFLYEIYSKNNSYQQYKNMNQHKQYNNCNINMILTNDPYLIDSIDETKLNDPIITPICKKYLILHGIHCNKRKKINWYSSKKYYFLDMLPNKMVTSDFLYDIYIKHQQKKR